MKNCSFSFWKLLVKNWKSSFSGIHGKACRVQQFSYTPYGKFLFLINSPPGIYRSAFRKFDNFKIFGNFSRFEIFEIFGWMESILLAWWLVQFLLFTKREIITKFFSCMFTDRKVVNVHKIANNNNKKKKKKKRVTTRHTYGTTLDNKRFLKWHKERHFLTGHSG